MRLFRPFIALAILAALVALASADVPQTAQELCAAAQPAPLTMMQFEQAEEALEPDLDYRAIFCTSAGAIYVNLYDTFAKMTVNNFVFLAQQSYYDNTTFHRVIPGFMAQGGDPTGSGRGGPGYQFADETTGHLTFYRPFLLAMANAGPGTNGSQFFITTAPTPHLNYKHTIFGEVLSGQAVVEAIRERDPQTATEDGETLHTVLIITDPTQVDNTDVPPPMPVTPQELMDAFLRFGADDMRAQNSEDRRESLPAAFQDDFADFAARYDHEFHVAMRIHNEGCNPERFFTSIGYAVDGFASADSAIEALADDLMIALAEHDDFIQPTQYPSLLFMKQAPSCHGDNGFHVLSQYTHGRFIISVDALVDLDILGNVDPARLIMSITNQLEQAFETLYHRELR